MVVSFLYWKKKENEKKKRKRKKKETFLEEKLNKN